LTAIRPSATINTRPETGRPGPLLLANRWSLLAGRRQRIRIHHRPHHLSAQEAQQNERIVANAVDDGASVVLVVPAETQQNKRHHPSLQLVIRFDNQPPTRKPQIVPVPMFDTPCPGHEPTTRPTARGRRPYDGKTAPCPIARVRHACWPAVAACHQTDHLMADVNQWHPRTSTLVIDITAITGRNSNVSAAWRLSEPTTPNAPNP